MQCLVVPREYSSIPPYSVSRLKLFERYIGCECHVEMGDGKQLTVSLLRFPALWGPTPSWRDFVRYPLSIIG
jgi:hypothetical protein